MDQSESASWFNWDHREHPADMKTRLLEERIRELEAENKELKWMLEGLRK